MLFGKSRKKQYELEDTIASLNGLYLNILKRLESAEKKVEYLEEKAKSSEEIAKTAEEYLDKDGNYNYQEFKRKSKMRKLGEGEK